MDQTLQSNNWSEGVLLKNCVKPSRFLPVFFPLEKTARSFADNLHNIEPPAQMHYQMIGTNTSQWNIIYVYSLRSKRTSCYGRPVARDWYDDILQIMGARTLVEVSS